MHLTQRQITLAVMSVITTGSLLLAVFYWLYNLPLSVGYSLASAVINGALLLAYRRGWEPARITLVVITSVLIGVAVSTASFSRTFHPLVMIPPVVALILTTPRWVFGAAIGAYLLILARGGWQGWYGRPEIIFTYSLAVVGIVISRMATDTVQRLADARQEADDQRRRAEEALALARQNAAALDQERAQLAATVRELEARERERDALAATVRQLALPVIPVAAGVLVLPLVGELDAARAANLTGILLHAVAREQARQVLIDITGVPLLDTAGAAALVRVTEAAALLGARCTLVGIRPEIAQTLVALGVSFANLATAATLQQGLRGALAAQQR